MAEISNTRANPYSIPFIVGLCQIKRVVGLHNQRIDWVERNIKNHMPSSKNFLILKMIAYGKTVMLVVLHYNYLQHLVDS